MAWPFTLSDPGDANHNAAADTSFGSINRLCRFAETIMALAWSGLRLARFAMDAVLRVTIGVIDISWAKCIERHWFAQIVFAQ